LALTIGPYLYDQSFPEELLQGVDAVTRRSDETYTEFILRAKENELGRIVKIADLEDNMDMTRLANPTPKDFSRLERIQRQR